jgi:hypothetical protein
MKHIKEYQEISERLPSEKPEIGSSSELSSREQHKYDRANQRNSEPKRLPIIVDPSYKAKVKEANGDIDKLIVMLGEYSEDLEEAMKFYKAILEVHPDYEITKETIENKNKEPHNKIIELARVLHSIYKETQ